MVEIICKMSKSGKKYFWLVVNGVYITYDKYTIEQVAMTNGISNIDLNLTDVDDIIKIKGV